MIQTKSHSKLYVGIDPGRSGAIARLDGDNMKAWKCPEEAGDMHSLLGLVIGWRSTEDITLAMEKIWARPNNATRAAFNYGVNYGKWFGVISSYELVPEMILPTHWMKYYDMEKGMEYQDRKKWLKAKAQELYPDTKVTLINADAILLAHYLKCR